MRMTLGLEVITRQSDVRGAITASTTIMPHELFVFVCVVCKASSILGPISRGVYVVWDEVRPHESQGSSQNLSPDVVSTDSFNAPAIKSSALLSPYRQLRLITTPVTSI